MTPVARYFVFQGKPESQVFVLFFVFINISFGASTLYPKLLHTLLKRQLSPKVISTQIPKT